MTTDPKSAVPFAYQYMRKDGTEIPTLTHQPPDRVSDLQDFNVVPLYLHPAPSAASGLAGRLERWADAVAQTVSGGLSADLIEAATFIRSHQAPVGEGRDSVIEECEEAAANCAGSWSRGARSVQWNNAVGAVKAAIRALKTRPEAGRD